jgi:hypothetical protein
VTIAGLRLHHQQHLTGKPLAFETLVLTKDRNGSIGLNYEVLTQTRILDIKLTVITCVTSVRHRSRTHIICPLDMTAAYRIEELQSWYYKKDRKGKVEEKGDSTSEIRFKNIEKSWWCLVIWHEGSLRLSFLHPFV